jgi:hypothetical protein
VCILCRYSFAPSPLCRHGTSYHTARSSSLIRLHWRVLLCRSMSPAPLCSVFVFAFTYMYLTRHAAYYAAYSHMPNAGVLMWVAGRWGGGVVGWWGGGVRDAGAVAESHRAPRAPPLPRQRPPRPRHAHTRAARTHGLRPPVTCGLWLVACGRCVCTRAGPPAGLLLLRTRDLQSQKSQSQSQNQSQALGT